ncbi:hypothetical protein GCM10009530_00220 [Microbispora corallina]|uniref:Major facilitator superfamily (MFS) profile domain-containing protein n=1 Tax=Microbispora corallina TaxID=83302 RepID=A0ABQ4FSF9_9ACTN|nr:hypothetical protein [Microbispora corallina]GIH37750.1 hypothetical protein Mco01_07500 [Microbispora corallina]
MNAHRPARDDAGTMTPPRPLRRPGIEDGTRYMRMMVNLTAMIGGPLFLLTVILHPARDGHDIAAHAQWYAFTHSMEAISLLVQATCLAGVLALGMREFGSRGLAALYTALAGTMLWFGLIVFDGGHNPVTAKYAPDLVHTSKDIDVEGGIIVLAANIVFPLGYVLLALLLNRYGQRLTGLLLGFGGVVYAIGGTAALFGFGPHSMVTSVFEIVGAAPYAVGYVLLGRSFARAG